MCTIYVWFKVIANLKFYKRFSIKYDLQKHFCIIGGVILVRQRNPIHRLVPNPMHLIYSLVSSTADKVSKLSPSLG
jgi:hypothetical protein